MKPSLMLKGFRFPCTNGNCVIPALQMISVTIDVAINHTPFCYRLYTICGKTNATPQVVFTAWIYHPNSRPNSQSPKQVPGACSAPIDPFCSTQRHKHCALHMAKAQQNDDQTHQDTMDMSKLVLVQQELNIPTTLHQTLAQSQK